MAVAVPPRHNLKNSSPVRILTAVPLCDGHDSAIMTINQELVRHGAEVVYLGYHQSASAIARAAIQEDVQAVGISSYNGGHVAFFREVVKRLRGRGAKHIRVYGGGGGTITPADERVMRRFGVEQVFFAGTPLDAIVKTILKRATPSRRDPSLKGDGALGRAITLTENRVISGTPAAAKPRAVRGTKSKGQPSTASEPFVLGVAGPGGAGKSTLIDELTSRFLRNRSCGRIAILANDPSHVDSGGALLGDRVSAIYSQNERVFFRSIATRGHLTGLSAAAPAAIDVLRRSGAFDLILVESVGIGQDSDPFRTIRGEKGLVDAVLFVVPPHYGGRLQLEKIALLDRVDFVALNKCDDPRAPTAKAELAARLHRNARLTPLYFTVAASHNDVGIDQLYAAIAELAGLNPGGERPCQLQVHG